MKKLRLRPRGLYTLGLVTLLIALMPRIAMGQGTQYYNPVSTAVPSLALAPDARSAGLGEQGVATSADAAAQYWNVAKLPFAQSRASLAFSYTPWMRKVTEDVALMHLSGYYQIGGELQHTLGASLRYFSMGDVQEWNAYGQVLGSTSPKELGLDVSYSLRLGKYYGLGIALRYISANQNTVTEGNSGSGFAVDLGAYMQREGKLFDRSVDWRAGLALRNVGDKIRLSGSPYASFIPTTLALGAGGTVHMDKAHSLGLTIELSKLLVPTPPLLDATQTDAERSDLIASYRSTSAWKGLLSSFSDAPGGMSEELRELRLSVGAEYSYMQRFHARLGYAHMHPSKGNLQGFTFGLGFSHSAFNLDASYMISTIASSPLDETLRFSVAFNLEGVRALFR